MTENITPLDASKPDDVALAVAWEAYQQHHPTMCGDGLLGFTAGWRHGYGWAQAEPMAMPALDVTEAPTAAPFKPTVEQYREADRIVTDLHDRGLEAADILKMDPSGVDHGVAVAVGHLAENWQDESAGRPRRHTLPSLAEQTKVPFPEGKVVLRDWRCEDIPEGTDRDEIEVALDGRAPTYEEIDAARLKGEWPPRASTVSIDDPTIVAEEIRAALSGIVAGDLPDRMVEHYLGEMGAHVEIGGKRMTYEQYEAATRPLQGKLYGIDPGEAIPFAEVEYVRPRVWPWLAAVLAAFLLGKTGRR